MRFFKFFDLNVILFAAYPVIFLYSQNVQELNILQIFKPLVASIIVVQIIWMLALAIIKDRTKAQIVTIAFAMIFFSYGYVFDMFEAFAPIKIRHRYFLFGELLIFGIIVRTVFKNKNIGLMQGISRFARIAISTLLIISIVIMVPYEVSKAYYHIKISQEENSEDSTVKSAVYERPDIYYIVLDEYANSSTIKKVWGYDNSKFMDSLRSKGFYIAENSKTKYDHTLKALPSYLNMDFVDENTKTLSSIQLINSNKVMKYLKQKGYTTVALDGWYNDSPGKGLIDADFNFNFDYDAKINFLKYTDIFFRFSIDRTMLYPILVYPYFIKHSDTNELHRDSTLYILNKLQNVSEVDSPKFVYAHIICPHTPFVFDKNGGKVDSINGKNWKDPQYYLDQYIYIGKQIDEVVGSIIKNSKKPPIIIVQSDHGPRRSDIEKEETLKIFNAYLLPNGGNKNLYGDFSPINTFRYIFNFYFNDHFEILKTDN